LCVLRRRLVNALGLQIGEQRVKRRQRQSVPERLVLGVAQHKSGRWVGVSHAHRNERIAKRRRLFAVDREFELHVFLLLQRCGDRIGAGPVDVAAKLLKHGDTRVHVLRRVDEAASALLALGDERRLDGTCRVDVQTDDRATSQRLGTQAEVVQK
jgi:hypothetical protein